MCVLFMNFIHINENIGIVNQNIVTIPCLTWSSSFELFVFVFSHHINDFNGECCFSSSELRNKVFQICNACLDHDARKCFWEATKEDT